MSESLLTCANCGYRSSEYGTGVVLVHFRATDVHMLRALLHGVLDGLPCKACGRLLAATPTLIYIATSNAYWVPGTQLDAASDVVAETNESMAARLPLLTFTQLPDVEALKKQVRSDLATSLRLLGDIALESQIPARWQELDARVFAAAAVANTVPGVAFGIGTEDGELAPPDELQRMLARWQLAVWHELLAVWMKNLGEGRSLERDLATFIGEEVVGAEDALQMIDASLEKGGGKSSHRDYVLHATRAAIAKAARIANTRESEWARVFFALEIAAETPGHAEELARFRISAQRATATIGYEAALGAAQRWVMMRGENRPSLDILEKVHKKIGRPDLVEDVFRQLLVSFTDGLTLEKARDFLTVVEDVYGSIDAAAVFATPLVQPWIKEKRGDDVEALLDDLLKRFGDGPHERAVALTWFGQVCKLMHQPNRFFARVGDDVAPWEKALAPEDLVRLWTERANNDRLAGRYEKALVRIREVIRRFPEDLGATNRRVAQRTEAVLLRETGALDESLQLLERLVTETEGAEKLEFLHSLFNGYLDFNRTEDALRVTNEAVAIARGPFADELTRARAERALVNSLLHHDDEVLAELHELGGKLTGPALIAASSAWFNATGDAKLEKEDSTLGAELLESLQGAAAAAEDSGDVVTFIATLRLMANIAIRVDRENGEAALDNLFDALRENNQFPDPIDLLAKADCALQRGARDVAFDTLLLVPIAIADKVGLSSDTLAVSIGQTRVFETRLDRLADRFLDDGGTPEEARLIGEIKRDVVGRAQRIRQQPSPDAMQRLNAALRDNYCKPLVTPHRTTVVIEFVGGLQREAGVITIIDADGNGRAEWLPPSPVNVANVAATVRDRLVEWKTSYERDLFDFPEWTQLETWLASALANVAPPDAHVVFIEHEALDELPWHVAVRSHTASYARSWSSLLLYEDAGDPQPPQLAVVMVPGANDSSAFVNTLVESLDRTLDWTRTRGVPCATREPLQCDVAAVCAMMETATHVKFLCHGFVNEDEHEVALMVASDAQLPLESTVAFPTPHASAFRLGWRQFRTLTSAPRVVFSAACSSGVSHAAGLGERVGLWSGLQRAGTRTLIAPRWKLFPRRTLPTLDRAMELMLGEHLGAAEAVHRASLEAAQMEKPWVAWALAVDGDWR
ncbi:MAG TPA: CHAT domain-containing protein [Thermoanaerobaculia bacterium]|nr:CHAT domain-containing protein [Thermoanaerobaculia bacterium]